MSESRPRPADTDAARAEALAWLSGQFRWETLLADLHELAEAERQSRPEDESEAA